MRGVMDPKDAINLQLITLVADNPALPVERTDSTPIFPDKKLLFRWGDNPTTKGVFKVGQKTLSMLPVLQRQKARETIPLDYEHNTVPGTPAYEESKDPRDVAGHLTLSVVEGEGIYAHLKNITPSGRENIPNFSDLSPAISYDKDGEIIFISSVALTQAGSVFDLELLNVPLEGIKPDNTQEKTTMDYRAQLIALLKLSDEASDEDIQTALDQVNKIEKEELAEEGKEKDKDKTETLSHAIAAIGKRLDKSDRSALLDRAHREGKVLPLSDAQIEELPITVLSEMVDKLPETVPLSERTPHVAPHRVDASHQSSINDEVRKGLGISQEMWDSHNK